jgi:hypothetical protein
MSVPGQGLVRLAIVGAPDEIEAALRRYLDFTSSGKGA